MPPADGLGPTKGSSRWVPRWLWVLAAALFVARIGTGWYEARHAPAPSDLVRWQPIAAAGATRGNPVLYDFTADWCPPCQAMQREVFADPRSAQTINQLFVPVRVLDRSREEGRNRPEVDALQRRFGVSAFPTLVVVHPASDAPLVVTGYPGKKELMDRLVRWRFQLAAGPNDSTGRIGSPRR